MNPSPSLLSQFAARRAFAASVLLHGAGIAAVVLGVVGVANQPHWQGDRRAPSHIAVVERTVFAPTPPAEMPPVLVQVEPPLAEPPPNDVLPPLPEARPATPDPAPQAAPPPVGQRPPRPDELVRPLRKQPESPVERPTNEPPPPEPQPTEPAAAPAGADVEPSPLPGCNTPPAYPWTAWRRGIEGTVTVLLEIDRAGAVTQAHVVVSSGCSLLDDAALQALRQWRFALAEPGHRPVRTHRQDVVFRLSDR